MHIIGQLASFTVVNEWHMVMDYWCHFTDRGKPKYPERNPSEYHFVYLELPWLGLGSNTNLRAERPATSLLIPGTVLSLGKYIFPLDMALDKVGVLGVCSNERYNSRNCHLRASYLVMLRQRGLLSAL
jgi:hypothetical protein